MKLQVVALTADKFRDKVTVTDADVAAHFDAHKADYRVGEQRKIKYFLLDQQQARLKVMVTPNEVERYYNQNIERYRTPEQMRASHILLKTEGKDEAEVRTRAEDVLKQVKGGGDFAALAKQVSEDDATKANGGDLDYFSRGRMVPEFENAAFAMKPGEPSDLVKSLVRLPHHQGDRPEAGRDSPARRGANRDQRAAHAAEIQPAGRRRGRQLATTSSRRPTWSAAPTRPAPRCRSPTSSPARRRSPGWAWRPRWAIRHSGSRTGEVAGPIDTPRGPVFMSLADKKDPYIPELDEVKDRVRDDVIRDRRPAN